MKLYGIPNCNTVKKARIWLEEQQIEYTFHDFKKVGVNQTLLDNWLSQQPWEKLVNRAGMTWRKLNDDMKNSIVDNASAAQLMTDKTSVIKRPILESDGKILALGFKEETYKELFK
ncbi:MAG: ArsC family reductase [Methylophilaceae bacterium]